MVSLSAVLAVRMATAGSGAPLGEYRWLPLFVGLFLSGGFLHVVSRTRLKRFYLYLAAAIGGGLLFALTMHSGARQEAYGALATLLWGLSGLLMVTGIAILIRFIRRNPILVAEGEGGGPHEQ